MKLPETLKDFVNILLGKVDSENELDLKEEIMNAKTKGIISDKEAVEIMQTVTNVKNNAKKMDQKQMDSISLEDGRVVSVQKAKEEKEKLEQKKKENEFLQRNAVEHARINNEKQKAKNKLQIDREKILKEMEKAEKEIQRDGKNEKSR